MFTRRADKKLYELDCLRGFAAAYVVLYHVGHMLGWHGLLSVPARFGQEAVLLFFVLSGFVIHNSFKGDFGDYWAKRFRRIYPVLLPALLLTYVCASITAGALVDPKPLQLLGNLAMLQDRARAGTIVTPYLNDLPLWSLSYEWVFYMLYAAIMRWAPQMKTLVALTISAAGFVAMLTLPFAPGRFAAYFMLWWLGVAIADVYRGRGWGGFTATAGVVLGAVLTLAAGHKLGFGPTPTPGDTSILELRHFAAGLAAALLIVGWSRLRWVGFRQLFGPFFYLAPISYGLYLVHYPLLKLAPLLAMPLPLAAALMVALAVPLSWLFDAGLAKWLAPAPVRKAA